MHFQCFVIYVLRGWYAFDWNAFLVLYFFCWWLNKELFIPVLFVPIYNILWPTAVPRNFVYIYGIYIASERNWNRYRDQIENIVPCRNVHTGLRQGQVPGPIVSYCVSPPPTASPGPVPVQCELAITSNILRTGKWFWLSKVPNFVYSWRRSLSFVCQQRFPLNVSQPVF